MPADAKVILNVQKWVKPEQIETQNKDFFKSQIKLVFLPREE